MNTYLIMKYIHILGVCMFIGNMLVTALLKGLIGANKTPNIVAFGQRFISITDVVFFATSSVMILFSGFYMNSNIFEVNWLNRGSWLFVAVGIIWGAYFIPIQIKQARLAKVFKDKTEIPVQYWRLEKMWTAGGIVAMILIFALMYFMIFKPQ